MSLGSLKRLDFGSEAFFSPASGKVWSVFSVLSGFESTAVASGCPLRTLFEAVCGVWSSFVSSEMILVSETGEELALFLMNEKGLILGNLKRLDFDSEAFFSPESGKVWSVFSVFESPASGSG